MEQKQHQSYRCQSCPRLLVPVAVGLSFPGLAGLAKPFVRPVYVGYDAP
ncbi:MAG: hypothetical protein JKY56_00295 [Kofleriaceae bacterium]|nr:hypothetical protein [Kofleriaceae bacterium]